MSAGDVSTRRLGLSVSQILWFLWLIAVALLTVKVLIWHLDYFKHPSPQFYRAARILWPTVVLSSCGYVWLRRKTLWKFEVLALTGFAMVALLYYEPRATMACAALFLASYTSGNFVARKAGLTLSGPIDRIMVGFGIGCGLLIPALFVLGLAKLLYPVTFLLLILIPPIFLYRDTVTCCTDLRALHTSWKNSIELRHPMVGIAIAFSFIAAACSLMVALAPSITFDTLLMHLPSVQRYASAHTISPIREIDYSYFPQGGEALWTLVFGLAGQAGAQMSSLVFFWLFLTVLFRLARECGADRGGAIVGTIWAGTLPFLHWTGSVMKSDIILAFFQALALYAFSRWLSTKDFRWIVIGAFFLAQSFGVKHVALFGAIPLAGLYAYAVWRQPRRWRAAALVAVVFLLFGAFWAVRTYLLTGNPVFPENTQRAVSGAAMQHGASLFDKAARYAKLPWVILFDGSKTFESPLRNPAGILLFAFFPLAIILARARGITTTVIACVIFVVIYLVYWATVLSVIRYAILPIALLIMLIASAAMRFYNGQEHGTAQLVRASVVGVEIYCLLVAAMGMLIIEVNAPQLAYFTHRLDKAGYLRNAMRTYGSLEYLQGAAEPGASILGIDNCSRAYAPEPFRFECQFCPSDGCKAKDLEAKIAKDHPRYIILPEHDVPANLIEEINQGRPAARMYRDEYFSVFQIGKDPVSPAK